VTTETRKQFYPFVGVPLLIDLMMEVVDRGVKVGSLFIAI